MFKEAKGILLKNVKRIIGFELIFKLLTAIIVSPLIFQVFKFIMKVTGHSYLTPDNFLGFLIHPVTIIFIILFLFLMAFYSIFDMGTVIILLDASKQNKEMKLSNAMALSLKKSAKIFKLRNFGLIIYILFLIPLLNLGTGSGIISSIRLPEFISDFILNNKLLTVLIIAGFVVLFLVVIRWIYSMHYFFLEDKTFGESQKASEKLIKKSLIKDILKLLLMEIVVFLMYAAVVVLGIFLIFLFTKIFHSLTIVESVLISITSIFMFVVLIVFTVLQSAFIYSFISVLYYKHKEDKKEEIIHVDVKEVQKKETRKVVKGIRLALVIALVVVLSIVVHGVVNGKLNLSIDFAHTADIIAHRGASVKYPENTMAAFIGAKELGADWAELDVQQTKDKKAVVSHDSNFLRTTGVDLNTWEATEEDIKKLDGGSFKGEQFKGEHIPFLDEVVKWSKANDLKLNIEIKPTGHETNFEEQVIQIIKDNDYQDGCVVISLSYDVVKRVKEVDSSIKTVYITPLAIGDIGSLESADAFSIEASNIDDDLVRSIHNHGKVVYAWTVNTEESIRKMIDYNVDGIVTDDLTLGKKLALESKQSDLVTELLKLLEKLFYKE